MNAFTDLLDRILPAQQQVEKPARKEAPPQPQSNFITTVEGAEPPAKNQTAYLESYRLVSWIYKAVKKNAEKVSEIDLKLMKHGTDQPEEIDKAPVLELLAHVNNFMTFPDLVYSTMGYMELVGEAYWALMRNGGGQPVEIWPLRPDKVSVKRKEGEFINGYIYKPTFDTEVVFEPEDIIPFKEFDPLNPFRGMGAVMAVAYAGDTDLFAQRWNRRFFFNAAIPLMAIIMNDTISDENMRRIRREWNNTYQGIENAHKTAILRGVKEILKDIQPTHKDMQYLDLRRFNRDEIIAIFGVPRTVMGITEDVNRSNAEATTTAWLEHEIRPKMLRFTNSLSEFLLRAFNMGDTHYFDFADPVPNNREIELEFYKAQGYPWLTPNEIREAEGMGSIGAEGDKLYIPFNLTGIDSMQNGEEENQLTFESGLRRVPLKKPKQRLKEDILKALHSKEFKNVMGHMMGSKKREFDKDRKEKIWKQLIKVTDRFEDLYIEQLQKLFNQQQQEVLNKLNDEYGKSAKAVTKQSIEEVLPLLGEWEVAFKDTFKPLLVQLVTTQGIQAAELIGEAFDTNTERIQRFLENEGLAFAKIVNQTTIGALQDTLSEGVKEGEGISDLSTRVQSVYAQANNVRAENIARTEVLRGSNFARQEAFEQSGVEKKEWLTALDERTCVWCNEMDGKIIELDGNFFEQGESFTVDEQTLTFDKYDVKTPPLHPQCRCTLIPIVD